ncbi:MAG: tetratricopeptide repeat protein [Thermoplasmata archaeon]
MFRPGESPAPSNGPAAIAAEARRLYQVAAALESHHDRSRQTEAFKVFLAFVESHRKELAPVAEEIGSRLDETTMTFYRLSQPDLAGRAVEAGLGFLPNSAPLLHHKALILLAQNRNLEFVLPLLDRALAVSPHEKAIWATKGDALRVLGRPEGSIEAYLHAQQLDTGSTQYVDRALKVNPRHAGALRMKLEIARAHGGERPALAACEELLKEAPEDPDLLLARADLLVALGDLEEATRTVARVRAKEPEGARSSEVYARLLFALGRAEEARAECRRLLDPKANPDPTILAELADRVTHMGGDTKLALELRERVRQRDPRNVANLQALRDLAIAEHRSELAIEADRAVLAVSPGNLQAMRSLAELYLASGQPDEAFAQYRELVRAHPRELGELRKAMVAAQSAGRADLLGEFAQAVVREAPEDAAAQEQLARALADTGRIPEALAGYDHLLARRPGEIRYLLEKKRLLVTLGRRDLLPPVYDELFRQDPTRSDLALERGNFYLSLAYEYPDGSTDRAHAARAAMVSYERASLSPERRAPSLLGLARAARVVHLPDRSIQTYREFLSLPGSERRADARKELGHILRESHRLAEAEVEYSKALQLELDDMDLLWGEVEVLTQLNQEAAALRFVDLLLLKEPRNPLFLRRRGQLLLKLDRRAEALTSLTAAVEAGNGDPHICFEVADALRAQGAYPDAVGYYQKGLELDPKSRNGRLALADALLQSGRFDEAVPQVDRLLHEDPNDLGAWRVRADAYRALRRTPDLVYSLTAILLLDPENGRALFEKAQLHLVGGEKVEAYSALQRLCATAAKEAADPKVWLQLADLAGELGQVEEANRAYDRAAGLDPAFVPEVANRRARLRLAAGRPDLALELLDGDPTAAITPEVLLLRAEILLALERPEEARKVYEEVRARAPENRAALAGIGRVLLDEGKAGEARTLLRELVPKLPPDASLFLLLAEAEAAGGELEEAAGILEKASALLPSSEPIWSRLAEVRIRQESWPKAAEALAHAMAHQPKQADLALRAGFVAEKLGHGHGALSLYEHATEIAPSNKSAWTSRGLALLSLGRPDEANASFDRALGLDSDYEPAKEGKKAALEKTREAQIERHGREALLLEARLGRPVTRNDLFVTLHVSYDLLEPVLKALSRTPKIDLAHLSGAEMQELEAASCQLVTSALEHRPEGIDRGGLTLADVAVLAPATYTLGNLQRLFGYIRSVLEMELRAENLTLTSEVEELARRALLLPEENRTLFQLVRTLRVGLYKARVIKVVEAAGGAVHAPLPSVDLGQFTPEFRPGAPAAPPPPAAAAGRYPSAGPSSEPTAGFFPVDDEAGLAPPMSEPPFPDPDRGGPVAPTPAPRCLGCGGIPSFVHSCGATLCQHCIAQYGRCPKCSLRVDGSNTVPIRGGPADHGGPPSRASSAGAPPPDSGTHPSPPPDSTGKGALRGFLGRAKATLPGPIGGSHRHAAADHEPAKAPADPHHRPAGPAAPGRTSTAPTGRVVSPEPPAPPPPAPVEAPPRPRPRRDDEPRL